MRVYQEMLSMKLSIGFLFSILLLKCTDESGPEYVSPDCNEMATVVDYSGIDGCGLLLRLSDGKLLMAADKRRPRKPL